MARSYTRLTIMPALGLTVVATKARSRSLDKRSAIRMCRDPGLRRSLSGLQKIEVNQSEKILPGFMMPLGSNTALIAFI